MNGEYFVPLSRAEGLVGQSKGEGGGNPIRVQTITGKFPHLFDEIGVAEVAQAILSKNATVFISSEGDDLPAFAAIYDDNGYTIHVTFAALGENAFIVAPLQYVWAVNAEPEWPNFSARFYDSNSKTIVDATEQLDNEDGQATIIWHPLK